MTKFKGFTLYIPSADTSREGVRLRLTLPVLAVLFLLLVPFTVVTISSAAGFWGAAVLEYRCGIEKVKRQVNLARFRKLSKRTESYKTAIQKIIEADKICRISYGMMPLDSGKLQVGVGGTALKSEKALENQEHRDIVSAYRLLEQFDFYARQTRLISSSAERVEKRMEIEQARLRETPSIIPARGEISSQFGYRFHPVLGYTAMHDGVDLSGSKWTPILAAADGIVVKAEYDNGGYGKMIEIRHTASGYRTRYAHLAEFTVSAGDAVKRGEQIGSMGSTGRSTGTHLHYEVLQDGALKDPQLYFVGAWTAKR